ncbi:hypothetical protein SAMN05216223_102443 [Actinacidiphila yanglinensis]|uniref:Uncharacterized protein n=1 Tax=Actinacidiphila yanglinensis TaxID=310779 RepID=A0A1H5VUK1_9ACTN|nr:hypothetical protein SAMN05216223_102443 [Actinacidiphila yanglinensis]
MTIVIAENAAQGVDGLVLEAESDVGVDLGGDGDVGVAEEFLDRDQFDALNRSGSGGDSDVPRVWWSHLAGEVMSQSLSIFSVASPG